MIQSCPRRAISLKGPLHPGFPLSPLSLYVTTSESSGNFIIAVVFGPFFVCKASVSLRFDCMIRNSSIAFRIAIALFIINSDGGSIDVIRGYAPNTSSIRTSPSRPAVSLIAFTAIYRHVSSSIPSFFSSVRMILYTRRSGS